jgi:hypothetical protein
MELHQPARQYSEARPDAARSIPLERRGVASGFVYLLAVDSCPARRIIWPTGFEGGGAPKTASTDGRGTAGRLRAEREHVPVSTGVDRAAHDRRRNSDAGNLSTIF